MANAVVIICWVAIGILAVLGIYVTHKFPPTSRKLLNHVIFAGCAVGVVFLFPMEVQVYLFSPPGVMVIGALFPVYESLRAVCTAETDDDTSWLQYWCAMGALYFTQAYLDDYHLVSETVMLNFHRFEFFFFLWLWFPLTDGSTLAFDFITVPLLAPWIKPLAKKMTGCMGAIVNTFINALHLWVLFFFFMFLPAVVKRFVTIAVGAVYPLLASVVAVTTEETDDDTYWLTYWSCYALLFTIVDFVETWLGKIPGFYVAVLFTTVYLMLPMFQGSEKVFRHILVPLAGLKEMLLLRDAIQVKKDMLMSLPMERQSEVSRSISKFFAEEGERNTSNQVPKKEGYIRRSLATFFKPTEDPGTKGQYGAIDQDPNLNV